MQRRLDVTMREVEEVIERSSVTDRVLIDKFLTDMNASEKSMSLSM